jgi:phosphopantothenoylcysteine decarboxylase/phosphopantothenate--cysteine ligase
MHSAVFENINPCDIFIGAAAVADYRPIDVAQKKIKKKDDTLTLTLQKNADILADVAAQNAKAAAVYQSMKPKKAAAVLAQLNVADAAAILAVLPDDQRTKIISELDPALASAVLKSPLADQLSALTSKPQ